MKYSLVIWDFNGTILDDLDLSLNSINIVLKKRDLPIIEDKASYRKKFGFPIEKYYEKLGMDFTKEPYKIPADEWVKLYNNGKESLTLTEGVKRIINYISNSKTPQWVLSASEISLLRYQMTKLGIIDNFEYILGCSNVYGHGKIEIALDFAKKAQLDLSSAVLIGDTDHDFQTALALGCNCILYNQGHMDNERLKNTGATVIDSMDELLEIL